MLLVSPFHMNVRWYIDVVPNTSHLKVWKNNQYIAYNYSNDNVDDRIIFIFRAISRRRQGSHLMVQSYW